ncbi:glutathione S-transferase T3-like [Arachis duranensis]|uniref:Glutathione S-transferase T3-like n=1 Tax=Arachis duranensis TaxID=130453 RepID=A0A6P4DE37_ARADU|nr:glutathione S-transferase T3-like [Arachis duranensis]
MTKGVVAYKKRWYKINKAVTKFAGCYDQASRNIRSGSNADDIKELAYKLYSTNYETTLADKPGVDSPVRPQGSKKSKRKGKEKTQMSENFSEKKSSVVKKLSLMEDIKNVREKELMDREKEREEERKRRAKIMAIKEKKLQIQARVDATERRGLSPLQKCTAAIRMLAYGVAADAVDDCVRIGKSTTIECLEKFVKGVILVFEDEYLRKPNPNEV